MVHTSTNTQCTVTSLDLRAGFPSGLSSTSVIATAQTHQPCPVRNHPDTFSAVVGTNDLRSINEETDSHLAIISL